jgi:hypothetical protein
MEKFQRELGGDEQRGQSVDGNAILRWGQTTERRMGKIVLGNRELSFKRERN